MLFIWKSRIVFKTHFKRNLGTKNIHSTDYADKSTLVFCIRCILFILILLAGSDSDLIGGYHSVKSGGSTKSNSLFVIVTACVIGGIVIVINILVISFLMRKKQKQQTRFGDRVLCRGVGGVDGDGGEGSNDPRLPPIGLYNHGFPSHKSYRRNSKPGNHRSTYFGLYWLCPRG